MIPIPKRFYQHRYGGIYVVDSIAKNTVDKSSWVVYTHIWPFDSETYIRPYDEWCDGRFKEIGPREYLELTNKDRTEFQNEIATNKASKIDK